MFHVAVVNGSARIFDTTGRVFHSVAEFSAVYMNQRIGTVLEIPHSVIIQMERGALTASGLAAAGNILDIGLEVIPAERIRGIHGYGYNADGHRVGNWLEEQARRQMARRVYPGL